MVLTITCASAAITYLLGWLVKDWRKHFKDISLLLTQSHGLLDSTTYKVILYRPANNRFAKDPW